MTTELPDLSMGGVGEMMTKAGINLDALSLTDRIAMYVFINRMYKSLDQLSISSPQPHCFNIPMLASLFVSVHAAWLATSNNERFPTSDPVPESVAPTKSAQPRGWSDYVVEPSPKLPTIARLTSLERFKLWEDASGGDGIWQLSTFAESVETEIAKRVGVTLL